MSTPASSGGKWISVHKRLAIYFRDGFQCAYCSGVGYLSLDHVRDCKTHGRDNSATNLVTSCETCNSSKSTLSRRAWFRVLRSRGIDTNAVSRRIARLTSTELDIAKGKALKLLFKGEGTTQKRAAAKREAKAKAERVECLECRGFSPMGPHEFAPDSEGKCTTCSFPRDDDPYRAAALKRAHGLVDPCPNSHKHGPHDFCEPVLGVGVCEMFVSEGRAICGARREDGPRPGASKRGKG